MFPAFVLFLLSNRLSQTVSSKPYNPYRSKSMLIVYHTASVRRIQQNHMVRLSTILGAFHSAHGVWIPSEYFCSERENRHMAVLNHGQVRLARSDNDLVTEAAAPASFETPIPTSACLSGNLGGTPPCPEKLHSERSVQCICLNQYFLDNNTAWFSWLLPNPLRPCRPTETRCPGFIWLDIVSEAHSPQRLFGSYKSITGCVFTWNTGCCSTPELGARVGAVAITLMQE